MKNITFFIFIFRNDEKSNLKGYYSLVTQKRKKEKKKKRKKSFSNYIKYLSENSLSSFLLKFFFTKSVLKYTYT